MSHGCGGRPRVRSRVGPDKLYDRRRRNALQRQRGANVGDRTLEGRACEVPAHHCPDHPEASGGGRAGHEARGAEYRPPVMERPVVSEIFPGVS